MAQGQLKEQARTMHERGALLRSCVGRAVSGAGVATRSRRAFTLMEVMVAVGAVALVAVGLASIFDSVGKTLSGGRRVSHLSTYAALMEAQMRADFESMTRDGFLVIRQQWVDQDEDGTFDPANDRVPLFADQPQAQWRSRRIDEIVFFGHGEYATMRQPLLESRVATSDTARIYYGHGQRRRANADPLYIRPEVFDDNAGPGQPPLLGRVGNGVTPNSHASEWMLLRHATLLVNPETTPPSPLAEQVPGVGNAPLALVRNKNLQIALQPAAANIFRSVVFKEPAFEPVVWSEDLFQPWFASGVVDIATTDLAEMRAFVTTFGLLPSQMERSTGTIEALWQSYAGDNAEFAIENPPLTGLTSRPGTPAPIDRMHLWMSNALPTQSLQAPTDPGVYTGLSDTNRFGTRTRYERQPIDLLGVIDDFSGSNARDVAVARANQLMLESANFVPRCSEFIVEWSFGQVDQRPGPTYGQLLWYGLSRRTDTNHSGQIDGADLEVVAPYPSGPYPTTDAAGTNGPFRQPYLKNDDTIDSYPVSERLVYGHQPVATALALTSHFGYIDPTFDPDRDGNGVLDDDADSRELSKPWPWPRLIRVTVTLADPQDAAIESTFQFIFKAPDASSDTGI